MREAQARLAKRLGVTKADVLGGLTRIAFHDVDLGAVTVRDKLAALELLARHVGMSTRSVRPNTKTTIVVVSRDDASRASESTTVDSKVG